MRELLYPILLPIISGFICLVIPKRFKRLTYFFCQFSSIATFFYSFKLFQLRPFINKLFFLDNLAGFIILFIAFFGVLIVLYSLNLMRTHNFCNQFYAYILWTIAVSILSVLTNNLIILIVGWGFLALLLYLLINLSGPKASDAAKKSLVLIGGTDSLMLLGVILIWHLTNSLEMSSIRLYLDRNLALLAFFCILSSNLCKAGAMPFHTWIPDTAENALIPVTAFLPASLDKLLGIYLLARMCMSLFIMNTSMNFLLMIIGAFTILGAVMMALIQHDFKRLLGYHAVSQVGYMVLGIGTGNPVGIAGGIFHMLNHAIYKSCLFLSGGDVEYRAKTSDLDSLGGLARYMPLTFLGALIASLSISGVPPFNGFFSKWLVYQGVIQAFSFQPSAFSKFFILLCLVAAMFGSALTLASFIKFVHSIFLGESDRYKVDEAPWSMWLPSLVLSILCILFGVFAVQVPIKLFISPSVGEGIEYSGLWKPDLATLLIILGILIGLFIYLLGSLKLRRSEVYIGGEITQEDMRFSGVEFYNTIKEAKPLKNIYRLAEAKFFDIYDQTKNFVFSVTPKLQRLHNGVLPTYLVWCLLGMLILFFVFG